MAKPNALSLKKVKEYRKYKRDYKHRHNRKVDFRLFSFVSNITGKISKSV